MRGILDIPNELIHDILGRLPVWEAKDGHEAAYCLRNDVNLKALHAVTLSCKQLQQVGEPFLYRTFISPEAVVQKCKTKNGSNSRNAVRERKKKVSSSSEIVVQEGKNNINWTTWNAECITLRNFIRTILARPELALHVKTLVIYNKSNLTPHPKRGKRETSPKWLRTTRLARQSYRAAVQTLTQSDLFKDLKHVPAWLRDLCRGTEEAELALLLSQLPNLAHLALVPPMGKLVDRSAFSYRRMIFCPPGGQNSHIHRFAHLTRLTLLHEHDGHPGWLPATMQTATCMGELYHLPTLRVLDGMVANAHYDMAEHSTIMNTPFSSKAEKDKMALLHPLLSHQSAISSLNISAVEESHDNLYAMALIATCKSLLKMSFTAIPGGFEPPEDCQYHVPVSGFNWHQLTEALACHQTTIQQLSLDVHKDCWVMKDDDTITINQQAQRKRSFRNFKVLKDLRINESVCNYRPVSDEDQRSLLNMLPSSLENLTITGVSGLAHDRLDELFRGMSHSLPRLKTITLEIDLRQMTEEARDPFRVSVSAMMHANPCGVVTRLFGDHEYDLSQSTGTITEEGK